MILLRLHSNDDQNKTTSLSLEQIREDVLINRFKNY